MHSLPSPVNYKISFPADYRNIPPLRELIFHTAILEGFSRQKAEQLKSVVDELCSNAIEHGSQPTSEVLLEVHTDEKTIRITCQDQGHGNKLSAAQIQENMNKELADDAKRGRGVSMIVKNFVDEMMIRDREGGGIIVSITIHKQ